MRNIPERAGIPEIRKLDVAFCECGGPLDFFLQPGFTSPTGIGQIIESCARCKRSNVMRPVQPRRITEQVPPSKAPAPKIVSPKVVVLAPWKPGPRRRLSNDELIRLMQQLAAELGKTPGLKALRASPYAPSPMTYARRWGSLTAAQAAAGLTPNLGPQRTVKRRRAA